MQKGRDDSFFFDHCEAILIAAIVAYCQRSSAVLRRVTLRRNWLLTRLMRYASSRELVKSVGYECRRKAYDLDFAASGATPD